MRSSKGRPFAYYICSKSLLSYLAKEDRCPLPSVPRDKLDNAVWRFVEALYENPDAILASFQEAQAQRRHENAATEGKVADLEHTLNDQRTKQENLWLEMASLPKEATSAKTALHNVLARLDEAIAEGFEKVRVLSATLLPVPDNESLAIFWEYRDQVPEGLQNADTVEKKRRVIEALNVTVSVHGDAGKPKASLHWWGIDTPLTLEDEPSGGQGSGSTSASTNGVTGNGLRDIPLLRAKKVIS